MAKRGFRYIKPLAEVTRITYGHLRNAITCTTPDHPLNLADVYVLAEALRESGESVEDVVRDIVKAEGDGTPDPPPEKKTKDTTGPTRRKDSDDKRTGPKRAVA